MEADALTGLPRARNPRDAAASRIGHHDLHAAPDVTHAPEKLVEGVDDTGLRHAFGGVSERANGAGQLGQRRIHLLPGYDDIVPLLAIADGGGIRRSRAEFRDDAG